MCWVLLKIMSNLDTIFWILSSLQFLITEPNSILSPQPHRALSLSLIFNFRLPTGLTLIWNWSPHPKSIPSLQFSIADSLFFDFQFSSISVILFSLSWIWWHSILAKFSVKQLRVDCVVTVKVFNFFRFDED